MKYVIVLGDGSGIGYGKSFGDWIRSEMLLFGTFSVGSVEYRCADEGHGHCSAV